MRGGNEKPEHVAGHSLVKVEELPVLDVKVKIETRQNIVSRPKMEDEKFSSLESQGPSDRDPDDALPMSDMARMLIAKHEEKNVMSLEEAAAEKFYSLEHAKSGRSVCKGKCSRAIPEGAVRFGSSDSSNGYVMTMWRCVPCVTGRQLANVQTLYKSESYSAIRGWENLTEDERVDVTSAFNRAKAKGVQLALRKEAARIARDEKRKTQEIRRSRRERFATEPGDWFDWRALLENGELATEQASFLRTVCDWLGIDSSGTKAKLLLRLRDRKNSSPSTCSNLATEQDVPNQRKCARTRLRDRIDANVTETCSDLASLRPKKKQRKGSFETDASKVLRPRVRRRGDAAVSQEPREKKEEKPSEAAIAGDGVPGLRRSRRVRARGVSYS